MWYVWYYDDIFSHQYVRCVSLGPFESNSSAQRAAAFERSIVDISYIVLPY